MNKKTPNQSDISHIISKTSSPLDDPSFQNHLKILRKENFHKAKKLIVKLKKKKKTQKNHKSCVNDIITKSIPCLSSNNVHEYLEESKDNKKTETKEEANDIKLVPHTSDGESEYVVLDFDEQLRELTDDIFKLNEGYFEIKQIMTRFKEIDETRASGKTIGSGVDDLVSLLNLDEKEKSLSNFSEVDGHLKDSENVFDQYDDNNASYRRKPSKHGISRKKLKQMRRPSVSQLKQICAKPEIVESWDTTAANPALLVYLKAYRNTVPVPPHWSHKRRYLQGKRGLERSQFALPAFIESTRIAEIRNSIRERDSQKTLKQRMREKVRPRHNKMNIDYQTLYDACFKYATKCPLTRFGDVYFEGKETEMQFRRYTPGKLSAKCRESLGMTSSLDAPPWLVNMQRYGPPPSYPNLVIPGVNAHIPEGASLGFQPGGWGKPPTLEQLKIWGVTPRFEEVILGEHDLEGLEGGDGALWGQIQTEVSDNEEYEENELGNFILDTNEETHSYAEDVDSSGLQTSETPFGISDPQNPILLNYSSIPNVVSNHALYDNHAHIIGGIDSVISGLETPQSVDLRQK